MNITLRYFTETYKKIKPSAQTLILVAEGLFLLLTIFAFWHHSPGVREHWLWLLWYFFPFALLRLVFFWPDAPNPAGKSKAGFSERLRSIKLRGIANAALIYLLLAFILLSYTNYAYAPYHRESYLSIMGRPLLGMWMVVYMSTLGSKKGGLLTLLVATVGMGLVLALVALTTTDWVRDKSPLLLQISRSLPDFDYRVAAAQWTGVEGCGGIVPLLIGQNCFKVSDIFANLSWGFNPNEIAGALAWMSPVLAAFAVGFPKLDKFPNWLVWLIRVLIGIVFFLLFAALILGQSRFAVAGVLGSLLLVSFFVMKGKWRFLGFGFVGLMILLQVALLFNLFPTGSSNSASSSASVGVTGRDESSFTTRFEIWESAIQMMTDYPLTGVGMGMFRTAISIEPYLVPFFSNNGLPNPPHAHNEWLQMGADLGIIGFLLYIGWQIAVVQMVWVGWRRGDAMARLIAMAALAGLLGHALYGFGDAVTIWDRFQFVLWWLVGLATAQYVWVKEQAAIEESPSTETEG